MPASSKSLFNSDTGRRLLNVAETAQYLALDVDTVYRKAWPREVPSVKVGRALRFDIDALNRLIEQHTIKPLTKETLYVDPQDGRRAVQNPVA